MIFAIVYFVMFLATAIGFVVWNERDSDAIDTMSAAAAGLLFGMAWPLFLLILAIAGLGKLMWRTLNRYSNA